MSLILSPTHQLSPKSRFRSFAACSSRPGKGLEIRFAIQAPADARLVGGNDDQIAARGKGPRHVKDAVHELALFGPVDIAVIDIDHAVTVQDQGAARVQDQAFQVAINFSTSSCDRGGSVPDSFVNLPKDTS